MWYLLKSEIRYNLLLYVIYLLLTIGITILESQLADGGRFYVALVLFLVVQNWLSLKGKEKRDILFARLPRSGLAIGSLRITMILTSALIIALVYKGMHLLLDIQGPVQGGGTGDEKFSAAFGFRSHSDSHFNRAGRIQVQGTVNRQGKGIVIEPDESLIDDVCGECANTP